jgi:hypothetical protein
MSPISDEVLINQIKQQLEDSCESLDYATQLKLKQARDKALSQKPTDSRQVRTWKWVGMPSLAAAAAVAVITFSNLQPHNPESPESLIFQDMELLAVEEDLELIQELEFYQWLETNDAIES